VVREDNESGAEVYAGTLSAGGRQTFDSSKRYWMRAGRPEVLALSVNGASHALTAPAGSFIVTEAGIERSQ
jgi:TPP-dependent trihydroxycyclohexane-1,2-dione (THcHDO) dehydratase